MVDKHISITGSSVYWWGWHELGVHVDLRLIGLQFYHSMFKIINYGIVLETFCMTIALICYWELLCFSKVPASCAISPSGLELMMIILPVKDLGIQHSYCHFPIFWKESFGEQEIHCLCSEAPALHLFLFKADSYPKAKTLCTCLEWLWP